MASYTIGFSPCPNDTFIFDALVNKKIESEGIDLKVVLADVQTLNEWSSEGRLDITKLSFPAFFRNTNYYQLLYAGSALGKGVGPLLVSKQENLIKNALVNTQKTVLPGLDTTAHLLFSFAYPEALNKTFSVFSEIEDIVLRSDADLGVIIHENRFTYKQKGLEKIADLGNIWEQKMQVPVPLGGIAIKRTIPLQEQQTINRLIQKSLQYAWTNYPEISPYVKEHAQAMDETVMKQHIDLYVNNFSENLEVEGITAIKTLLNIFNQVNKLQYSNQALFIGEQA